jgi:predicted nucleic acid-binding protein
LNDALHAAYALSYASKLITFDKDFTAFQAHTSLPIEVLR